MDNLCPNPKTIMPHPCSAGSSSVFPRHTLTTGSPEKRRSPGQSKQQYTAYNWGLVPPDRTQGLGRPPAASSSRGMQKAGTEDKRAISPRVSLGLHCGFEGENIPPWKKHWKAVGSHHFTQHQWLWYGGMATVFPRMVLPLDSISHHIPPHPLADRDRKEGSDGDQSPPEGLHTASWADSCLPGRVFILAGVGWASPLTVCRKLQELEDIKPSLHSLPPGK